MKCWICGSKATTGEHITKASDLRAEFGRVTQRKPVYLHTKNNRNVRINSIKKSQKLKFSALLCATCNNAKTAPYDKAWEQMSSHLRNKIDIKNISILRLEKVFPGNTKDKMLNIHLYFVKLFGCAIESLNVPIPIKGFSEAILNRKAHPKIHISFGASIGMGSGCTDMETANISKRCVYAVWFYVVGPIAVQVVYAEPSEKRKGLQNTWHPDTVTKRVKLAKFQT